MLTCKKKKTLWNISIARYACLQYAKDTSKLAIKALLLWENSMYYEITRDGAGFLPHEAARMDVDGLYIRDLAAALCFKGSVGTLLINGSGALSPNSVLNHLPILGTLLSLDIWQRHEDETNFSDNIIKLTKRDFPSTEISYQSSSARSLLYKHSGSITDSDSDIAQIEFFIITPPEREKRITINLLNNLFAPLKLLDVHLDLQFNGEKYSNAPSLQLSQNEMKHLAEKQKNKAPYLDALHRGVCNGLFDITHSFTPLS